MLDKKVRTTALIHIGIAAQSHVAADSRNNNVTPTVEEHPMEVWIY